MSTFTLPLDFPRNAILGELYERGARDSDLPGVKERFTQAGVKNWLREEEKNLHFGIASCFSGSGTIVEIGSFEGGAAAFYAAGLRKRGSGKLVCVDPHLGAPPWLGVAPHQHTLEAFRRGLKFQGLDGWVTPRIGDSGAVASVWPAEPIDVVFIDADHSFRGALKDFECWAPKVRPGGLILYDDADDQALSELLELLAEFKKMKTITFIGQIGGVAAFYREPVGAWDMLAELDELMAPFKLYRAWDMTRLHSMPLPSNYRAPIQSVDKNFLNTVYQLAFMARCAPGPYGFTAGVPKEYREVMEAVSRTKGDGEVVEVSGARAGYRAIVCRPDEAAKLAPLLQAAGAMFVHNDVDSDDYEGSIRFRNELIKAGLEGCGWGSRTHWGFWKPLDIAPDTILANAMACYTPTTRATRAA